MTTAIVQFRAHHSHPRSPSRLPLMHTAVTGRRLPSRSTAASFVAPLVTAALLPDAHHRIPTGCVLNVNVPSLPRELIRGYYVTHQGHSTVVPKVVPVPSSPPTVLSAMHSAYALGAHFPWMASPCLPLSATSSALRDARGSANQLLSERVAWKVSAPGSITEVGVVCRVLWVHHSHVVRHAAAVCVLRSYGSGAHTGGGTAVAPRQAVQGCRGRGRRRRRRRPPHPQLRATTAARRAHTLLVQNRCHRRCAVVGLGCRVLSAVTVKSIVGCGSRGLSCMSGMGGVCSYG
jgi:hypothetical protein